MDLCEHLDHPELAADPRFVDASTRAENVHACIALLDEVFSTRTYSEWCERLSTFAGPWEPLQSIAETHSDPQTVANGYIFDVDAGDGTPFKLVGNPVQFDEEQATGTRAPEVGEHTEQVLLETGLSWDEIAAWKKAGVIT